MVSLKNPIIKFLGDIMKQIAIVQWIIKNMETIINRGIDIADIIEEPIAHPHYHSRTTYTLEYGEDDYGITGIVEDVGCSGSPSAWNHYRQVKSYFDLAESISNTMYEVEDVINDDRYEVTVNKELWNIHIDSLTTMGKKYPNKEELYL